MACIFKPIPDISKTTKWHYENWQDTLRHSWARIVCFFPIIWLISYVKTCNKNFLFVNLIFMLFSLVTNISFGSSDTQFYESQIFCLFTFWVFCQIKVLNNVKIHPKMPKQLFVSNRKKKTLCYTLNRGKWNSGFVKLGVWWAERDIEI